MTQPDTLLTAAEVADELRVHVSTVSRWVRDNRIAAIKLPGGHLRFRRADVDALIAASPTEAGAA